MRFRCLINSQTHKRLVNVWLPLENRSDVFAPTEFAGMERTFPRKVLSGCLWKTDQTMSPSLKSRLRLLDGVNLVSATSALLN